MKSLKNRQNKKIIQPKFWMILLKQVPFSPLRIIYNILPNLTIGEIIVHEIFKNILQRGIGNVNPMKMARCIVELERMYGIKQGRGGDTNMNNSYSKTQRQLALDIGIDQSLITRYKKLETLIPELQELVETDKLKATTAYNIWCKLSQDEQKKFFNEIGKYEISQMTQKQTQEYS